MNTACRAALCAGLLLLGGSLQGAAQTLPSEPIVLADGHLTLGGDVSASLGTADTGFFNYTDYEHSALRLLRLDLSASLRVGDHLALLGEVRSENIGAVRAYAFYVRIRPWTARNFDIQAGRVPPTFGAFGRRSYASDNPLVGYPLAYQYLTSLRADALPKNADELLLMRGRGWLSSFSLGNPAPSRGLPLASAFTWDTGFQIHGGADLVEGTLSLTTGTISNPLFKDDNSGRQLAGRAVVHPAPGLHLGVSAARGPFVTEAAARSAVGGGHEGEFTQTAWGADLEYSRDYYLVRVETIFSGWSVRTLGASALADTLQATATSVEGRYKIRPGLYAAARADHLWFSDVTGSTGRRGWEAAVTRVEIGGGYSLQRNLLIKASYQINTRDGGRVTRADLGAAQIVFWF